jgi:hypothetical protein
MSEERFIGIPTEKEFGDDPYLPAANLEKMADRLIETKKAVSHLYDFKVAYYWKRKGGKTSGQPVMGKCRKVSGDMKAFSPDADFMIWLAADNCREAGVTPHQAEAYLFHEMLHTQADENGKPITVPHDWYGFTAELKEYGLYDQIMQAAGNAFQQLRMLEA